MVTSNKTYKNPIKPDWRSVVEQAKDEQGLRERELTFRVENQEEVSQKVSVAILQWKQPRVTDQGSSLWLDIEPIPNLFRFQRTRRNSEQSYQGTSGNYKEACDCGGVHGRSRGTDWIDLVWDLEQALSNFDQSVELLIEAWKMRNGGPLINFISHKLLGFKDNLIANGLPDGAMIIEIVRDENNLENLTNIRVMGIAKRMGLIDQSSRCWWMGFGGDWSYQRLSTE
ncbi:hypothetical protein PPACK8108_LOCUS6686 [Phakopsora pachyrhizi]|uniref:Uncharacterized protein n=1 Tax=Phakopsora pachyrhizi TaxID=170000 RepID=A0AAV0AUZ7_PHAPC|nr:hypothetical protein PPACK8108_LOCUS6686 [Phakopsora pachyrhizi]